MQNADLTEKVEHYETWKNYYKKICKEILTFGDIEIENNFFCNKIPIFFKRCRY